MSKIEHEIKIHSDVPTVYQALTTLQGLQSWHSAQAQGEMKLNGQFTMKGLDKPTFSWKITELKPNQSVTWECIQGPGDAVGTTVWFNLMKANDGQVMVECSHEGWPGSEGNFRKCNTLWGMLLFHLKQFAETGKAKPTFN